MRFSSQQRLPPSTWIEDPRDTLKLAQRLSRVDEPYGFDLESDGLG